MRSLYLSVLLFLHDNLEAIIEYEFKVKARKEALEKVNNSFAKSLELQAPKKVACKYSEEEIERMSSTEYYWKVLEPRGIKKEIEGGVCL